VAEPLDQHLHLVRPVRIGERVLERVQLAATAETGPAPSMVSATALRPDISPTSWEKWPTVTPRSMET